MRKITLSFSVYWVFWGIGILSAQTFPVDTTLNFTSTPLIISPVLNAHQYRFTVEQLGTANTFEKETSANVVLLNDLKWDQSYRWRCSVFDKDGKLIHSSPDARFLVRGNSRTDHSQQRLEIIERQGDHADDYLFLDYASSAVDRRGNFAWYLPENPLWNGQWERLRDIRLTDHGTVTFIHEGRGIFETDLAGNVLWVVESPIQDTAMDKRYFHHEFFRAGDHYFVLAMESYTKHFKGDTAVQSVPYDQVLEYDQAGQVVWKWDAHDYFVDEEFIALRGDRKMTPGQGHMNSLSVSPDGKYLYGGFRNISRVVKIRKRNGKVVRSYGQRLLKGRAHLGHHWFRRQHNATILPDGHRVLVFNNDSVMDPAISSSLVMFDDRAKNDREGLLWEFDLKFDTLSDAKCTQTGSVELLPNGNFLAGLGTVNRIIEVSPEKEVVWDAFVLRKSLMEKDTWDPFPQYRVHSSATLWPVLFGVRLIDGEKKAVEISNEGSVADSYQIEFPGIGEGPRRVVSTDEVAPGQSVRINLPIDDFSDCRLQIFSKRNPRMVQRYPAGPW